MSHGVFLFSSLTVLSHFSEILAPLPSLLNEVYTTLQVPDLAVTATICN